MESSIIIRIVATIISAGIIIPLSCAVVWLAFGGMDTFWQKLIMGTAAVSAALALLIFWIGILAFMWNIEIVINYKWF